MGCLKHMGENPIFDSRNLRGPQWHKAATINKENTKGGLIAPFFMDSREIGNRGNGGGNRGKKASFLLSPLGVTVLIQNANHTRRK
jgi:hypothetical protein